MSDCKTIAISQSMHNPKSIFYTEKSMNESKVEVTIQADRLDETMEAIRKVHPYEEPVINVIKLEGTTFTY